jgi:membrane fusion protein, multidrug efflux system
VNVAYQKSGALCVVTALALLAACKKSNAGGAGGFGGGGPMALPVEVAAARTDTVRDEIAATGQIEAVQSIDLRPEVDGRIVAIPALEGQEVEEGTPLFKVDDAQLKAQVAQLEAQRDLAQQALARAKELAQQNASSAADLEQAEATARSAQAQYDLQRIRLDRTTVRAPFGGVVGQRYVSLGDYVTTSTKLASLQTVNPQRAAFQVPERFARMLRPGQKVTFRVAAIAGRDFTGEVDFVDPVVELPGRTILVKARVPNGQRLLQAGMFIEARLVTAVRPKAVVVPEEAIVPAEGSNVVWVVTDGKADRRQVSLGVRTPGLVEVTSGVQAGEQVVVGGLELLAPGAPVRPMERRPPSPGAPSTATTPTTPTTGADSK